MISLDDAALKRRRGELVVCRKGLHYLEQADGDIKAVREDARGSGLKLRSAGW